MVKLLVLGSGPVFPYPRTKTNRFSDYLDIGGYEEKFELHDDIICNLAKKGGKERRLRSSLAVITGSGTFLIDAGPDIIYQLAKYKVSPDVILITHNHSDANFGLKDLKGVEVISEKAGNLKLDQKMDILGAVVTAFRVAHAGNVTTVGFRIGLGKKVVAYISDLASLRGVRKWVKDTDILFADGSILDQNMPSHLSIIDQLKYYKKWRLNKVVFTHIGHKTLPHDDLQKYCRSIYKPVDIAYDGQNFKI